VGKGCAAIVEVVLTISRVDMTQKDFDVARQKNAEFQKL
jgi:hypothetical protein